MSDLRARIRALRGEAVTDEDARDAVDPTQAAATDARFEGPAVQLGADVVAAGDGLHLRRTDRWAADARHGRVSLGGPGLDRRLRGWAARALPAEARAGDGPVVYLDTETTGLAGGTGTLVFLVGLGVHDDDGFAVEQFVLPGPQYERGYLEAIEQRLRTASALVSYNGASFDLPLLRTRFALHGLGDPTDGVPHLDLLPLARRLFRERLPDCRLNTIEDEVLGVRRGRQDVPGAEVPMRYRAFLRTRDATGLRGVLEHNRIDIVALTAFRVWLEARVDPGPDLDPGVAFALARWLDHAGESATALAHLMMVEHDDVESAWEAARLLRRAGRTAEALDRWRRLAASGDPRGWVELAKHFEHRERDPVAALDAAEAARAVGGAAIDDLEHRIDRLRARIERQVG